MHQRRLWKRIEITRACISNCTLKREAVACVTYHIRMYIYTHTYTSMPEGLRVSIVPAVCAIVLDRVYNDGAHYRLSKSAIRNRTRHGRLTLFIVAVLKIYERDAHKKKHSPFIVTRNLLTHDRKFGPII